MIYFDSVALESVAPVKVDDIHVSPVPLSPVTRQRAIRFGADYVRMGGGARTVNITFALLEINRDTRRKQLDAITNWAQVGQKKWLQLPNYEGRHLEAVCTSLPEPSLRMWWESKLRLVFTCFDDPFWIANDEKSAACGSAFFVGGNAHDGPLMRIERTLSAAASNQAYSDGNDTMTFSSIPAGNMVIDLNRQTAAVGGVSFMQYYTFGSHFIQPKNGTQTITGTGTVKFRERWE